VEQEIHHELYKLCKGTYPGNGHILYNSVEGGVVSGDGSSSELAGCQIWFATDTTCTTITIFI
jgi:hypothetical protein